MRIVVSLIVTTSDVLLLVVSDHQSAFPNLAQLLTFGKWQFSTSIGLLSSLTYLLMGDNALRNSLPVC